MRTCTPPVVSMYSSLLTLSSDSLLGFSVPFLQRTIAERPRSCCLSPNKVVVSIDPAWLSLLTTTDGFSVPVLQRIPQLERLISVATHCPVCPHRYLDLCRRTLCAHRHPRTQTSPHLTVAQWQEYSATPPPASRPTSLPSLGCRV